MNGPHAVPGERGAAVVAARARRGTRLAALASAAVVIGGGLALVATWYASRFARAEPPAATRAPVTDFRLPRLDLALRDAVREPSGERAEADDGADAAAVDGGDLGMDAYSDEAEYAPPRALEPPPTVGAAQVRAVDAVPPAVSPVLVRSATASAAASAVTRTPVERVEAVRLPDRRYWVPKGHALDCTLKTAIDSTLAGLATCVTATDLYGADGAVVLLERGTELTGRVLADVRAGQARVGVTWEEARTPGGVLVALDAPATDALGRTGLEGAVDRRFGERFGAALLLSVIDAGLQVAVESQRSGGSTVIVDPRGANAVAGEILKETVAIPPTIRVPQGARVQVLTTRHLDFEPVYRLVSTAE